VVPSDLAIAHHAVVNAVPPSGQDELAAMTGPDGYFDCFGGINVPDTYFLGVWVPGSLPFEAEIYMYVPKRLRSAGSTISQVSRIVGLMAQPMEADRPGDAVPING